MTFITEKQEVLRRFCALGARVAERRFDWHFASDCFCGDNFDSVVGLGGYWRWDAEVLEFIEQAVEQALAVPNEVGEEAP